MAHGYACLGTVLRYSRELIVTGEPPSSTFVAATAFLGFLAVPTGGAYVCGRVRL